MMMTLFVEHYGYYMDHELMAASAGYVRDSFVMASLDQISEYEHLERILMDAVCTEPIIYDEQTLDSGGQSERTGKNQKYQKKSMFRSHTSSAKNHNLSQRNGKAYNALCRLYICALSSYDLPKDLLLPLIIPLDHDHDGIAGFKVRVLVME